MFKLKFNSFFEIIEETPSYVIIIVFFTQFMGILRDFTLPLGNYEKTNLYIYIYILHKSMYINYFLLERNQWLYKYNRHKDRGIKKHYFLYFCNWNLQLFYKHNNLSTILYTYTLYEIFNIKIEMNSVSSVRNGDTR